MALAASTAYVAFEEWTGRRDVPTLGTNAGAITLPSCQLLLDHTKLESTVRYLGIEADDALVMSEQTDI